MTSVLGGGEASQQKASPPVIEEWMMLLAYLVFMSGVALGLYTRNKELFTGSIGGMVAFFAGLLWYEANVMAQTVFRKNSSSLDLLLIIVALVVTSAPLFVPIYIFFIRRKILEEANRI